MYRVKKLDKKSLKYYNKNQQGTLSTLYHQLKVCNKYKHKDNKLNFLIINLIIWIKL